MTIPRFLKLPPNLKGRDFVVGDVHGCVHLLEKGLDQVRFDPAHDRVYIPGDLSDRGPYSTRSVRFVKNPFVFACRGNHEDLQIELFGQGRGAKGIPLRYLQENGLDWWLDTPESVRQELLDLVQTLPYAIETRTFRGSVGFVHAEVPIGMDWPTFTAALEAGVPKVLEQALWGRTRIKQGNTSGVAGIDRLFVGHSVVGQPGRLGNVYYLDTGASAGVRKQDNPEKGRLTMARLVCGTQVLADVPSVAPVGMVDVRDGSVPWLFGQYAKPVKSEVL